MPGIWYLIILSSNTANFIMFPHNLVWCHCALQLLFSIKGLFEPTWMEDLHEFMLTSPKLATGAPCLHLNNPGAALTHLSLLILPLLPRRHRDLSAPSSHFNPLKIMELFQFLKLY